jgi:hypothetical protein
MEILQTVTPFHLKADNLPSSMDSPVSPTGAGHFDPLACYSL